MKRFALAVAAALVLAPLAGIGPASAAVTHPASTAAHAAPMRPANDFDGNPEFFANEGWPSLCARIAAPQSPYPSGALIIGSGDCTPFKFLPGSELEDMNSGQCLYYDSDGFRDGMAGSYDLAACAGGVESDEWESLSNHAWSIWATVAENGLPTAQSMWARGSGHDALSGDQNGSNSDDRWQATDCDCDE